MAKTWQFRRPRARASVRVLGPVSLVGIIGATLVVAWSDATPNKDIVDTVVPSVRYSAFVGGYTDHAHVRTPIVLPTAPAPRIPAAPPALILIPSLNVHRPVEAVGLDRYGKMHTPQNWWNAGWYKGGPVPGAPGDALIEGHAGFPDAPLLFGKLPQLRSHDKIVIVLADGSRHLFLVESVAIWPAGKSPPSMGEPYGVPRLTLITCTGPFDDHYKTYADRLIVKASYGGLAA